MPIGNRYGLPASQTLGTLSGVSTASDAEERKKRRQAASQTPQQQQVSLASQTFAKLQENGEARPAPPPPPAFGGGYNANLNPSPATPTAELRRDRQVGEGIDKFSVDYSQIDPDELAKLSNPQANENGARTDAGDALRAKLQRGEPLTPTEQYYLQYQSNKGDSVYRVYRPQYNPVTDKKTWVFSANDALLAGVDQNGNPFASNADYFDQLVALGQLTPEQANFYRNAQGRSPGGAGSGSASGYTPGSSSGGLPGQVAGAVGYNGYAQYGAGQAESQQSLLEQAITSALSGQGGYSQQLLNQLRSQGRNEIQSQYDESKRQLEGEMAKRGIAASSIALERSSGLMGQNQRALADFETNLAKQVEDAARSDRQNAISAGLTLRGQQSQESQFGQTFGLSVAQFNQQADQWAQQFGLDKDKFAEATRQFNASLAQQDKQFGMTYSLNSKQFEQQAAQWAQQFGLDEKKFTEATRQFNQSQAQQDRQFNQSQAQQDRQFQQNFGLSEAQFRQSASQFAQQFGLDQAKFSEASRQFSADLAERQRQFGMTYDLNSREFEERAKQWAQQYGLDRDKFTEAIRQFTVSTNTQQDQFNRTYDQNTRSMITQIIQGLSGKVDANTLAGILKGFGIDPSQYLNSNGAGQSGYNATGTFNPSGSTFGVTP